MFSKKLLPLVQLSHELCDISSASGVLAWDQEVMMPEKGASTRAHQLAALAGIYHEQLTNESVNRLISESQESAETEADKAIVREIKREHDKATKLPKTLVEELSRTTSRAFAAWQQAKQDDTFATFAPLLEQLLSLRRQAAELTRTTEASLYDVMLDDYEEGLTTADVAAAFTPVRERLAQLAKKVGESRNGVTNKGNYPWDKQWEFGKRVLSDMGYDWSAGRLDTSPHPFTINFGSGDVRITTWNGGEADFRPALYANIHEGGHALYEQGVNPALDRTHLGGGQGLVIHESQSRLWENMIGRSAAFWHTYYPVFSQTFGTTLTEEEILAWVNEVRPSLIRVEADEVTYGLHIMLRFEIEQMMVNDPAFRVADLPELWRVKMKELLGVVPETDREGVLQDVHWSHGSFGYFPTYLLGTMTAAQLWRAVNNHIPTSKNQTNPETMKQVREWLRENIHQYGKLYTAKDLVKRVTGEPLNPQYFVEYLQDKFM